MSRSSEFHRLADRYCGIPLAALIGLFTPRRDLPKEPRRIGLIAATAIGDTILASGLIAHLRAVFPAAELHIFVGRTNEAALDLLATDVVRHICDFTRPWPTLRLMRALSLDVLIDLTPWPRMTALLTRFAGARCTVGFRSSGQHRHGVFNIAVEHSTELHETENLRRMASLFAPLETYALRLRDRFPEPQLALPYERLILMHACPGGSRAAAKSWPAERWTDLAQRLCNAGFAVGFTGTNADRATVERIMSGLSARDCVSLAGKLTLGELVHVMKRSRLVISIDTGVLHLASAADVPVIGLHGPTSAARWGATSRSSVSVDAAHPAAGYIKFGFESHPAAADIMPAIPVHEIFALAERMLSAGSEETARAAAT